MDLPAEPQIRWILRNTATLLELGAEPVRGAVLPTGEFFPDRFDGSPRSVVDLLSRVQEHAGLADLTVRLSIVTPEGEAQKAGCGTSGGEAEKAGCGTSGGGCCGGGDGAPGAEIQRVTRSADGSYDVMVAAQEVRSPLVLTTGLVRAISFMFMTEADAFRGVLDADREPLVDLAGVLLGFGVILANGSYIYAKGCHGVTVQSATRMPVDDVALALSIFGKLFDVKASVMSKHLEVTPYEQFTESEAWTKSNASLIRMLKSDPKRIHDGSFTIAPARSLLARVLGVGAKKPGRSTDEELAELERSVRGARSDRKPASPPVDAAKAAKLAELRALVDESLEG